MLIIYNNYEMSIKRFIIVLVNAQQMMCVWN